jgi:hypothetical protein
MFSVIYATLHELYISNLQEKNKYIECVKMKNCEFEYEIERFNSDIIDMEKNYITDILEKNSSLSSLENKFNILIEKSQDLNSLVCMKANENRILNNCLNTLAKENFKSDGNYKFQINKYLKIIASAKTKIIDFDECITQIIQEFNNSYSRIKIFQEFFKSLLESKYIQSSKIKILEDEIILAKKMISSNSFIIHGVKDKINLLGEKYIKDCIQSIK